MREYTITTAQLPGAMRREIMMNMQATINALRETAHQAQRVVVMQGPTDQGLFKHGWSVQNRVDGAELRNDCPHAAIIEEGSRPHWPPRGPLREWVIRKIKDIGVGNIAQGKTPPLSTQSGKSRGVRRINGQIDESDSKVIDRITYLVCRKISRVGTKPHFILRNNQPLFTSLMRANIIKHLTAGR